MGNTFHSSKLYGFFCELRRRKVYRVAGGYGVVAWLIIQFAVTVFPPLQFPDWSVRAVIITMLAGFPIALILAWAFDIGPGGIEVTPEPAVADCPPGFVGRRKNIAVVAACGLIASALIGYFVLSRGSFRPIEKSIAVLPFSNFSDEAANAFFADGIQDDLLTNLAKIGDLKVISRTSVLPYRGQTRNIREIGKALNVATVLEGSVRRDGNRVRVNVQLIDASNDRHLWAQVYDRELTDVFLIQSELAHEIASALRATLSPGEQARIERKPTENGDAYLLYLEAHEIFNRPDRRHDDLARAESLYTRAIQLDPAFALAHARLSQLESWMYYAVETIPARMQKARTAANEAVRLQPDLAEAHLALGLIYYYVERDYNRALSELTTARAGLPNDPVVLRATAAIQRRQGKWADSCATYEKAASLDPRDPILLENMGWSYLAVRNYEAAARIFDKGIAAAPESFILRQLRARVEFESKGDLRPMQELLAASPENVDPNGTITLTRFNYYMYHRNFAEAVAMLKRSPAPTSRGETSAPIPKSFLLATAYALMHDEVNARSNYEEALAIVQQKVSESPDDAPRHALLGLIFAGLGRCEEAMAEGRRAVELLPERRDAFDGPIVAISRARISTMCGDHDSALATLDRLLDLPSGITVHELRRDPTWDPLRVDKRFDQMLAKRSPAKG